MTGAKNVQSSVRNKINQPVVVAGLEHQHLITGRWDEAFSSGHSTSKYDFPTNIFENINDTTWDALLLSEESDRPDIIPPSKRGEFL